MGDNGSARPSRRVARRVAAAMVGVALAAVPAAVPRPLSALQDRTPATVPPDTGASQAREQGSRTPQADVDPTAATVLDADTDQDDVPDFMDACPGTPPGTPVGRDGCPPGGSNRVLQIVGIGAAAGMLLGVLLMFVFRAALREGRPEVPPLLFGSGRRTSDAPTPPPRPAPDVGVHGEGWLPDAEETHDGAVPAVAGRMDAAAAASGSADLGAGGARPGSNGFRGPGAAAETARPRSLETANRPAPQRERVGTATVNESHTELVDARTVRFFRPVDATMQMLPGRLEIVAGAEPGHVIRFVRIPGVPPEVTFGRSAGAPPLHVQLLLPTVSRRHARMRYADGGWRITNQSRTNPVVLNGELLAGEGESRALSEGDRIEMGEVAFVFRER